MHVVPIPLLGGLAMYGGLAAGLLVASQIPQLRAGIAGTGMISGLLLAGGLLVAIGFVDDRWGLSPLPKAGRAGRRRRHPGGHRHADELAALSGRRDTFIPTTDQTTVLTILVVVATINAVNFIDGLDGLAAGIVAIAAISFLIYYYSLTKVLNISALSPAGPGVGDPDRDVHRFPAAQLLPGQDLHGGHRVDAARACCLPTRRSRASPRLTRTCWPPSVNRYPEILPLLLPAALLVIPVRGPAARGGAPDPGRHVAVRAGPQAPASPAARHRPLAARQRADHVPVGRAVLRQRRVAVDRQDRGEEQPPRHPSLRPCRHHGCRAGGPAVDVDAPAPLVGRAFAPVRSKAAGNGQLPELAAIAAAAVNGVRAAATGAAAPADADAAGAAPELVSVAAAQPLPAPVVTGSLARADGSPGPSRSVTGIVPPAFGSSTARNPFSSESGWGSQPEPSDADAEPATTDGAESGQEAGP